jgi:hypothetical protein
MGAGVRGRGVFGVRWCFGMGVGLGVGFGVGLGVGFDVVEVGAGREWCAIARSARRKGYSAGRQRGKHHRSPATERGPEAVF